MRFSVPKRARRGRPRWTLLKSVSLEAEPTKRRRLNPICSRSDSAVFIDFGAHAVICVGFLELSGWAKAMGAPGARPTFARWPPDQAQSAIVCGSRQAQRRRDVCEGRQYAPRANRTGALKNLAALRTVAPFCSGRLHRGDPLLLRGTSTSDGCLSKSSQAEGSIGDDSLTPQFDATHDWQSDFPKDRPAGCESGNLSGDRFTPRCPNSDIETMKFGHRISASVR